MAFDGPNLSRLSRLPWGASEPDRPQAFLGNGMRGVRMIGALVDYLARGEFSAVLAPTHFLDNGPDDSWFEVDRSSVRNLRDRLDNNNLSRVLLYYPLALPASVFRNKAAIARIASLLETVPMDGVWLRIHPFGASHSGPLSSLRLVASSRSLAAYSHSSVHTGKSVSRRSPPTCVRSDHQGRKGRSSIGSTAQADRWLASDPRCDGQRRTPPRSADDS